MIEFTDRKGDRWVVRECDDDDHCVAVEWFMRRRPPLVLDDVIDQPGGAELLAAMKGLDEPREYPADDFHIPLESLGNLIAALQQLDRRPE